MVVLTEQDILINIEANIILKFINPLIQKPLNTVLINIIAMIYKMVALTKQDVLMK